MYEVGFDAVQVVKPTRLNLGFTSTLISAGWQVMDTMQELGQFVVPELEQPQATKMRVNQ